MDIKAIEEFRILGNLRVSGSVVEGVWTTTWDDDCLISWEVLKELLRTKENYISQQKSLSHMQQMLNGGALTLSLSIKG